MNPAIPVSALVSSLGARRCGAGRARGLIWLARLGVTVILGCSILGCSIGGRGDRVAASGDLESNDIERTSLGSSAETGPGSSARSAALIVLPASASEPARSTERLSIEEARAAFRHKERARHLRMRDALEPGYLLRQTRALLSEARLREGVDPRELRELGRLLFEHEFTFADGLANGPARARSSPFRRVHAGRFGGPETTTCASCHWRGGLAGAGSLQDASFFLGDGENISSADARNPPSLTGVGVVELLAREMSAELQATRAELVARARSQSEPLEAELFAKGVHFGTLRVSAQGEVDTSRVEGVDADLVIKPFGWKGTFATLREFVAESLQIHIGIQSEDLLAAHRRSPDPDLLGEGADPEDPDEDGVRDEFTSGQLSALVAFLAMQELPIVRPPEVLHEFEPVAENVPAPTPTDLTPAFARGRELFEELDCANCHVPVLTLENPIFETASEAGGAGLRLDLSRDGIEPRLRYDASRRGYPVWLFSDLKRHDLGVGNESRHVDHGVPTVAYQTRRLWGLASSPPFFYDGSAPWIDHAIAAHGGEAAVSRAKFESLDREDRGALRVYLFSLRRERRLVVP